MFEAEVNGIRVRGCLRDTGSNVCVIQPQLATKSQLEQAIATRCTVINGTEINAPLVNAYVKSPYFTGHTKALVVTNALYPLVVGNIKEKAKADTKFKSLAAQTRDAVIKKTKPLRKLNSAVIGDLEITPQELSKLQKEDSSLSNYFKLASTEEKQVTKSGKTFLFVVKRGILYRHFQSSNELPIVKQVVVPSSLRIKVLTLGHQANFAGHQGVTKTADRILSAFYFPGIYGEINRFCKSCDVCQRMGPKPMRALLGGHPIISEPFERIAMDLVGPIIPATERGHRYLLTAIDYSTRYPMAVALKRIDTETVADAMIDLLSNTGIPRQVLTDLGSQFTGKLMAEVSRLLSITALRTTAFHPQCNGLIERVHRSLKLTLKRLCADQPKQWDRYLSACLFSLREVPNESTGFSPFYLLFGRNVRSPMVILKEFWTQENDAETKSTYQYVIDLQERLETTCRLAQGNQVVSKAKQKMYYDRKAKHRTLEVGDQVLVLLPKKKNKLELAFRGPYEVTKKRNNLNYLISMDGKEKLFNINLLKRYHTRETTSDLSNGMLYVACALTLDDTQVDQGHSDVESLSRPPLRGGDGYRDVIINENLERTQVERLKSLLYEYREGFTDIPGETNLVEHEINLTTDEVIRTKAYPIPHALKQVMRSEIKDMLASGIIEPCNSPYNSPILLIKKADGSPRFTFDGRGINRITVFDTEPLPNMATLFDELHSAVYLSSIDLSKGYWQVPVRKSDRHLLSFVCDTDSSSYCFSKMPFGLINSSATFCRLMRIVLAELPCVKNYVDDIIVYTETFEQHLEVLAELFKRLREAGLTAKPKKMKIGFQKLPFLGHIVGNGTKQPLDNKVDAILNATPPNTKKVMRSFLGLIGFYRSFIPNFAAISAPLSDATKNGRPNKIVWSDTMLTAFNDLKHLMAKEPILKLPDFTKIFYLQTDASCLAISGCLMQTHNDIKFPVQFISRKLTSHEQNYSTIEQECLSLVYCLKKLKYFLLGVHFILETDAKALLYLNKNKHSTNKRLVRWSLEIQEYVFKTTFLKGSENFIADFLSRTNP